MHRSGTTFVADALRMMDSRLSVIHEPLNLAYGCHGVPCWYPYVPACGGGKEGRDLRQLLRRAVDLELPCRKSVQPPTTERLVRRLGRSLIGGTTSRSIRKARWRDYILRGNHRILMKDPFAILALGYLSRSLEVRCVVMVRHPAAIYRSLRRMNWQFDFSHLLCQPLLVRDYPEHLSGCSIEPRPDLPLQVANLWKILYSVSSDLGSGNDGVVFVKHEDFCLSPEDEIERIAGFLDLRMSRKGVDSLRSATRGTRTGAREGRLHDMERDARALARSWLAEAHTEPVLRLRDRVGDSIHLFYDRWLPE